MSLKDAFAGIRESRQPAKEPAPGTVIAIGGSAVKSSGSAAKSSHPEFEAVKVYLRKDTRRRAWRKWEDQDGGDFSDLVEKLLKEYLGR